MRMVVLVVLLVSMIKNCSYFPNCENRMTDKKYARSKRKPFKNETANHTRNADPR